MGVGTIILVIVLALSAAGGGTAYAAQGALPGDTLYSVKLATEEVRMLLPGSDSARTERALTFAERRIKEMETLAERERWDDTELASQRFARALDTALAWMQRASNREQARENVTVRVAEATEMHLAVLDTIYDRAPEGAKAAIALATDMSEKGRQKALIALARHDVVRAAQMNLAAMEQRLNRIRLRVEAGLGTPEELEYALAEFESMARFGQEIYHIGEETNLNVAQLAQLVTQATSIHLEVLASLYDRVPEGAKESIRRAMEQSFRGYEMIRNGLIAGSEFSGIPESIHQRLEDILGWTDAPKARMPTSGSSGRTCTGCRR